MGKQKTRICPVPEGYLTVDDIAKKIGVHPATVRQWMKKRLIHEDENLSRCNRYLFEYKRLKEDLKKVGLTV